MGKVNLLASWYSHELLAYDLLPWASHFVAVFSALPAGFAAFGVLAFLLAMLDSGVSLD